MWWELCPPRGIPGVHFRATALFHSQAPSDTFHRAHGEFCEPKSAEQTASEAFSCLQAGATSKRSREKGYRVIEGQSCVLWSRLIWGFNATLYLVFFPGRMETVGWDATPDLPLVITVMNGHGLLSGWHVSQTSAPTRRQIPQKYQPRVQPALSPRGPRHQSGRRGGRIHDLMYSRLFL